jgi:hypothetical protein
VTEPQYDEGPEQGYEQGPEQGYDERPDQAATSDDSPTAESAPAEPDQAAPVADPRVRDAVRRLDELSDLPPAEHVEIYEAVHSSLQESLAEASRQADESPPDGSPPS